MLYLQVARLRDQSILVATCITLFGLVYLVFLLLCITLFGLFGVSYSMLYLQVARLRDQSILVANVTLFGLFGVSYLTNVIFTGSQIKRSKYSCCYMYYSVWFIWC